MIRVFERFGGQYDHEAQTAEMGVMGELIVHGEAGAVVAMYAPGTWLHYEHVVNQPA